MSHAFLSDPGTGYRGGHSTANFWAFEAAESQRGSITVTLTCHFARVMISAAVAQRFSIRQQLVIILGKARDPERCIDELLRVCTTEGGPDGLDSAIDVLTKVGPLTYEYAWDYLRRDISNWNPSSERAYEPDDDYWYILLRAVGRIDAIPKKERYRFIACCASAESRGVREGVVEGLRDLGTNAAKNRLIRFADEDTDDFIRKIAREALDDLES